MVTFRVGDVLVDTLDDDAYAGVLEAAAYHGGPASFPSLFALPEATSEVDPMALMDDLARLANTEPGRRVSEAIGTLRDDLMTALAAAGEG